MGPHVNFPHFRNQFSKAKAHWAPFFFSNARTVQTEGRQRSNHAKNFSCHNALQSAHTIEGQELKDVATRYEDLMGVAVVEVSTHCMSHSTRILQREIIQMQRHVEMQESDGGEEVGTCFGRVAMGELVGPSADHEAHLRGQFLDPNVARYRKNAPRSNGGRSRHHPSPNSTVLRNPAKRPQKSIPTHELLRATTSPPGE